MNGQGAENMNFVTKLKYNLVIKANRVMEQSFIPNKKAWCQPNADTSLGRERFF
jgi:hypothetical protein